MSVVSSVLSRVSTSSSPWKINTRLASLMDSIFAIAFGLGLRFIVDAVSHHDFKLTGTLVGLWEGIILLHFLKKMPKSTDPYIAYAVRLFVDFLCTESVARLVLVLIWTGMGMVLADITPALWDDVGLNRIWRRFRRDLYTISRMIPTVAFFPPPRTVRFSPSREPSIIPEEPSVLDSQPPSIVTTGQTTTTPITVPDTISSTAPAAREVLKRRVPGYFPAEYSDTDTDLGSIRAGPSTGRTSRRLSVYPQRDYDDSVTDLSSNNDLDDVNLSSGASSASTERGAGPSSLTFDTAVIPDMEEEEEEQLVVDTAAVPVKDEEERTPRQVPIYLPPTPSDSAARWRRNIEPDEPLPVRPFSSLPQIPDFLDEPTTEDLEKIQPPPPPTQETVAEKPPTPPAKDDLPSRFVLPPVPTRAPPEPVRSPPSPEEDWEILKPEFVVPEAAVITTNDVRQSLPPAYRENEEFDDIYGDEYLPAPTTTTTNDFNDKGKGVDLGAQPSLIDDSIVSPLGAPFNFSFSANATADPWTHVGASSAAAGDLTDVARQAAEEKERLKLKEEEEEAVVVEVARQKEDEETAAAEAAAAAKQKEDEEAAKKKKLEDEEAKKKKEEEKAERKMKEEADELARQQRRQEEEAAEKKRLEEEAAAKKLLEEQAAEKKRLEEEAAEKKQLEDEAGEKKRVEEEEAARKAEEKQKKVEERARKAEEKAREVEEKKAAEAEAARIASEAEEKKREELAAQRRKDAEEAAARREKKRQEKEEMEKQEQEAAEAAARDAEEKQAQEEEQKRKDDKIAKAKAEKEAAEAAAATAAAAAAALEVEKRLEEEQKAKEDADKLKEAQSSEEQQQQVETPPTAATTGAEDPTSSPDAQQALETTKPEQRPLPPTPTEPTDVQAADKTITPEDPVQANGPAEPPTHTDDLESVVTDASELPSDIGIRLQRLILAKAQMIDVRDRIEELEQKLEDPQEDRTSILEQLKVSEKILKKMEKKEQRRYDEGVATHILLSDSLTDTADSISYGTMGPKDTGLKTEEKLEELMRPGVKALTITLTATSGKKGNGAKQKAKILDVLEDYSLFNYTQEDAKNGRILYISLDEKKFRQWLLGYRIAVTAPQEENDGWN